MKATNKLHKHDLVWGAILLVLFLWGSSLAYNQDVAIHNAVQAGGQE